MSRVKSALPVMILDYSHCLRIERGDDLWARPSEPYVCPECRLTTGQYSGKLKYQGAQEPLCLDHEPPVGMVPVVRSA